MDLLTFDGRSNLSKEARTMPLCLRPILRRRSLAALVFFACLPVPFLPVPFFTVTRFSHADAPVIPGLVRDVLDAKTRGAVLLGELGCVSCHETRVSPELVHQKTAPVISNVGERVQPAYLTRFLAYPHEVKPGTTMPDVFRGAGLARESVAEALTHFLIAQSEAIVVPEAIDHVAAERGRELFHDIGCVACHSPRGKDEKELLADSSVPLVGLEKKYNVSSLTTFLEAPHLVRPSGRMPSLHLSPVESYQVANYLVQKTRVSAGLRYTLYHGSMEEGPEKLAGKEVRGGVTDTFDLGAFPREREDFAVRFEGFLASGTAGELTFELETSHTGVLTVDGETVVALAKAGSQIATVKLSRPLSKIEVLFLHTRGAPKLSLRMARGGADEARREIRRGELRAERVPVPRLPKFEVNPETAKIGEGLFQKLDCGACHRVGDLGAAREKIALHALGRERGCVSGKEGAWPQFRLSEAQLRDLEVALTTESWAPKTEEKIATRLTALNCIACHERGKLGGVPQDRNGYYRSVDENLAEPGRLPPPLTGVGAKLQESWLRKTLARGQELRPYMNMRMPIFGEEAVEGLADWFVEVDKLPVVSFGAIPKEKKAERAFRDVGRKLIGDRGMNCIACHTFRGEGSSTMAAIDMIETTTKRLRKDWFYHYMLEPARFRASTIMPQFFADGETVLPEIGDGTAEGQLNAMWYYLSQGRNTGRPSGLRRPPMEIVVGDEAIMVRRKAQGSGKRAISIGYPRKISAIFDAESVSLQQIWRGQFIDPVGIWTGQGSGAVRVMSRDRATLTQGAPFAMLENAEAAWPTRSSRDLGIRFKGYDLDELRRPTFAYVVGDIRVSDKLEDVTGESEAAPFFRRRLVFESTDSSKLYLRGAMGAKLVATEGGGVRLGETVTVSAPEEAAQKGRGFVIRPSSKDLEAILEIPISKGTTELVLEYRFSEKKR